ncbi:Orotidine 5'-phosphate decarboxylase [Erysiphe neolycopersici]|uniref:Orotidine 5'-phosphate decarboxylase n=1 Tax=Erysiphe neolycopersici TaxID=212602 RepID=A0A420HLE2_9PEZI|nr:Orotidine 5'-phosphate decarboxylase [Erysiphe neolycopersici]
MTQSPSEQNRRLSYPQRATRSTHPLSSYLLRLMTLKKSNLCFSADVSSAKHLLSLANALGPSIVVLKTHYDLINNWDYNPTTGTGARLAKIARRHGFLIFEDRKFADIGNTVRLQYTEGTARIIDWSHIVNVNMIPGKASVEALAAAAEKWKYNKRYLVKTDISVGLSPNLDYIEEGEEIKTDGYFSTPSSDNPPISPIIQARKSSIVSITTVSQHFEPANSPSFKDESTQEIFEGIEEAPMERGLLILAQMSSEGNLATNEYTNACVKIAREFKNYVMGFVSQESLNSEREDQFLTFTPGCQLPPSDLDKNSKLNSDGKGQQYNTPSKLVEFMGSDIIIVGRGIIGAVDPVSEAQRYRAKGWEAYKKRISPT